MTFVVKYIRSMFMTFDGIIYSFVEKIYNLFLQIASVNFFETDIYTAFQSRIYIFLSVIMLFKLSFSLLTYIVNPDNFSDKEKGMGKLVMNSIIVICLIAFVPTIFDYSRRLQTAIVSENIIPSFILGTETGTVSIDDAGKNMSFITFSAFFQLDKDFLYAYTEDDEELYNTCRNDLYAMSYSYADGDNVTGINNDCIELINNIDGLKFDEAFWDSSVSNVGDVLSRAASYQDVKYLADSGVVNVYAEVDGGEKYIIDYSFIISTIAGVFLAWIFLIFCFDIAVRAVKLAFLELVAPIPIISYLDPKSGKNGVFSRWTKECLKTYADLFVRLIAIFFALFVISRVGGLTFYEGTYSGSVPVFVKVFIILGVLLFAKQLPKLLENILGVKMDGKFTLNPMKKLGESPFSAAAVGGAGALAGAAASNLYNTLRKNNAARKELIKQGIGRNDSNYREKFKEEGGRGFLRTFGSMIGGATSASLRAGYRGIISKGDKSAGGIMKEGIKGAQGARNNRAIIRESNYKAPREDTYTWSQRNVWDRLDRAIDVKNKDAGEGKLDKEIKILKRQQANIDSQERAMRQALADYTAKLTEAHGMSYNEINQAAINNDTSRLTRDQIDSINKMNQSVKELDDEFERLRKEISSKEDIVKTRESGKNNG